MGFFKKLKKSVKKIAHVAKRPVAAVATGGLSEIARATGHKDLASVAESVFAPTSISDLQTTASLISGQPQGPSGGGGEDMSLGNVLGGVSGLLNTVGSFGGPVGTVAQIGSGFLSGFLPAQGPMVSTVPQSAFPQATQTMAARPIIGGMASAATAAVQPILNQVSAYLGKSITLRAAMIIIRRMGKFLNTPTAIATALGITLDQLGNLIVASSIAGSGGRRMNVGNVKALRRAHRRIKSFHKLCTTNDELRAPRRRRAAPKQITVCR